ncbi:NAD-dependent protein deacetylase sirtuin-6 [Nymphon striatum]|nr:NAD-dependent protein deacetylase sirtuin-6 [Nymphon striatum]
MSCNYAEGLSEYEHKGKCGMPEMFDDRSELEEKVKTLSDWIRNSKHVIVFTGAGISTSAGIPDFRGPKGVWTLDERGEKPSVNLSFDDAVPTPTHMALVEMARLNIIKYVISQNVDGLHLKSGLSKKNFSELHGNMFLDKCDKCKREFVRNTATKTLGQKPTGQKCPAKKRNGHPCRGKLHDTVLDWEDELPNKELDISDEHSRLADLSITLGTSLQILPCGNLPLLAKKKNGRLVICNLQPTKHDKRADLKVHAYVDDVMELLAQNLGFAIPKYHISNDPTKNSKYQNIDVSTLDMQLCNKVNEKNGCYQAIIVQSDDASDKTNISKNLRNENITQNQGDTNPTISLKQESEETFLESSNGNDFQLIQNSKYDSDEKLKTTMIKIGTN